MSKITREPNDLLAALSESDRRQLAPHLTQVELRLRAILAEPYTPLKHAYFLHESMVSLVCGWRIPNYSDSGDSRQIQFCRYK